MLGSGRPPRDATCGSSTAIASLSKSITCLAVCSPAYTPEVRRWRRVQEGEVAVCTPASGVWKEWRRRRGGAVIRVTPVGIAVVRWGARRNDPPLQDIRRLDDVLPEPVGAEDQVVRGIVDVE